MKKLIAVLGIVLLAGCQIPAGDSDTPAAETPPEASVTE